MKEIIFFVVFVCFVCTTTGQDGSLSNPGFFSILPASSSTQLTGAFSLFMDDNHTKCYFFSSTGEPIVWSVDLQDAVNSVNITGGDSSLVKQITVYDNTGALPILSAGVIDKNTSQIYMASTDRVYLIYPNGTVLPILAPNIPDIGVAFQSSTAEIDQNNGAAYFPNSVSPSFMYKLDFSTLNITYSPLSITSTTCSVFDETSGYLYIGGIYGDMEKFNTITFESEVFISSNTYLAQQGSQAGATLKRGVVVLSAIQQLLYVCTEIGSGQTRIDILDAQTLIMVANYSVPFVSSTSQCTAMVIDDQEGELFLGLSDVSAGTVFAFNLVTGQERDFIVLISDEAVTAQVVGAFKTDFAGVVSDQVIYMITGSQIAVIDYLSSCPNDCSGNGECFWGNCTCEFGWTSDDCSSRSCDGDCYGNGECADGTCVCSPEWTSENCSVRQCANACSGHGTCSGAPSYVCACIGGWYGSDCDIPPPPPPPPTCDSITTESTCSGYKGCGWCIDDNTCRDGSIKGPYYGSCKTWSWQSSPATGVIALACVFIGILGLMFIFNAFSAIRIDFQRAADFDSTFTKGVSRKASHAEASALWWRDQRSAKTWLLVEQLQFLVLVSHITLDFPTTYIVFTKFFDWTNFGLPLPFYDDTDTFHPDRVVFNQTATISAYRAQITKSATSRNLLGFEAYSNSLGIDYQYLFGSNMFWVGVAAVGIILIYQLLSLICLKLLHWRTTLQIRMIYLLVRLMNMAYVGMVMTSAFAMMNPAHRYQQIAPGAVVFVVVGILYPLGVGLLLRGDAKKLLNEEFRYKFGCLYTNYRPGNRLFVLFVFIRKGVTAAIVGFLNYSLSESPRYLSILQVIAMGAAQILYTVAVIIKKPYYDYYHEYLEYFLCVINLATLGLSMWQYHSPSQAGMLITGLVQTLGLIACVGVYLVSWVYMNKGANLLGFITKCISFFYIYGVAFSRDLVYFRFTRFTKKFRRNFHRHLNLR